MVGTHLYFPQQGRRLSLNRLARTSGLFLLVLSLAQLLAAQDQKQRFVPGYVPGRKAIKDVSIVRGGTEPLQIGTILIRNGRIEQIGPNIPLPPGTAIFEAQGNFAYPAFVDAGNSTLLLPQPEAVPQAGLPVDTSRFAWGGTPPDHRKGLTPEFEAASRLDLNEAKLDLYRQSGVGLMQVLPRGRIMSGWGTLLLSRGGAIREAVQTGTTSPVAQFFRLLPDDVYPSTTMGSIAHVRQFFLDARRHQQQQELHHSFPEKVPAPEFDPGYQQLQKILQSKPPVVVIADTRDEIERALDFGSEQQLSVIIWGGREADRSLTRLKEKGTKVIWTFPTEEKPNFDPNKDKPADQKSSNASPADQLPQDFPPVRVQNWMTQRWNERWEVPGKLLQAGIPCALSSHGLKDSKDFLRNARQLLEHGLPESDLLRLLTADSSFFPGRQPAHFQVGSPAQLVVLNGPLKEKESAVRRLFLEEWEQEFDVPAVSRIETKPELPPATPMPPPPVAGDWQLKIKTDQTDTSARLQLVQVGTQLSGKFESEQGNGRISKGTVSAESLEFTVQIGAGDRSLELHFQGAPVVAKPGSWGGSLKSTFGTSSWTAIKLEKQESATSPSSPPVQLSLEIEPEEKETAETPSPSSSSVPAVQNPTPPEDFPTELESDRRPVSTHMPRDLLIRGGHIWTGEQEFPQADLLIRDGKITAIEPHLPSVEGVPEIDARGQFVMPGIIDTHSHIMISDDFDEINEFTLSVVPEVSIREILWTDDVSEYRALAGGVTTARILHGSANVIGGRHAIVKLRLGSTAREHALDDAPQGVKFALGENVKSTSQRFPNSRMGVEAVITRALQEARQYRQEWERYEARVKVDPVQAKQLLAPRRDLRLEALRGVLDQEIRIHSHSYRADEILMLLRVAESFGIRVASLQHVLEGYKVAPEIAAHGASCSTFSDWWAFKMEAYDAIPHNAALLHDAGINVCVKSDDWELIRHLNQEAAKVVRYGLAPDDALRAVTVNPSRELGLHERLGRLKIGFDADIAIFRGHPLAAGSRCLKTIIDGQVIFNAQDLPTAMRDHGFRNPSPPLKIPPLPSRKIDWTPLQGERFALVGATVIPVDSPTIPQGTILVEQGKIAAVGRQIPLPEGTPVIDVTGYTISPGLIDPLGTLGLTEIGKVRETHDSADSGELQPDLHAGTAVNADSELIPVARAGGITAVNVSPRGGIISGQSALLKLNGWTTPQLVRHPEVSLAIHWPDRKTEPGKKAFREFQQFWKNARLYAAQRAVPVPAGGREFPVDARYEALRPYLNRERPVCIEAHSRRMILEVLQWTEQENIRLILVGATDAWKVADNLKSRQIPLILGPIARSPVEKFDPSDAPYANPGRLEEAGLEFCFHSPSASLCRNLPFEASLAMSYGLSEAAALRGITLAPARILGLDREIGSLAVGKQADLVVSTGSLLEPTSRIEAVFIDGRHFPPESKQTRLADRYRQRITPPVAIQPAR